MAIRPYGEPGEVAGLMVRLSSAAARFVVGTPMRVDGGALA